MKTWMWISLWIVQTLIGAIGYRKYQNSKGMFGETPQSALIFSSIVITNIISCCVLLCQSVGYSFGELYKLIDYLAGVKNKTEKK